MSDARNVLGGLLQVCSVSPMTGFVRDGVCHTGPQDIGSHTVCVQMTEAFLDYSLQHGNDLISPAPEYDFPGLQPGDRWCMCAARWPGPADANFTPALLRESDGCKARRAGKGHPLPSGATPQTRFLAATRRDGSIRAHPFVASRLQ